MGTLANFGQTVVKNAVGRVKPNLVRAIVGATDEAITIPTTSNPTGNPQSGSVTRKSLGTKMGIQVADISKTWKLQRNYLWEVRLPKDSGEVAKYCQSIQFGDYSMTSPSTIRYGAFQAHYAGYMQVPPVTMTFLRPIPDIVTPYFHQWRARIVDDAGFFKPKIDYAEEVHLYMFDSDGTETEKIRFHYMFPNEFPSYDLSYNSSEIVKLKVTFQIDRIYFE